MSFELIELYEQYETAKLGIYFAGGETQVPTMTVIFVSGDNKAGVESFGNDEFQSGKSLTFCHRMGSQPDPQLIRFNFTDMLERVRFAVTWLQVPTQVQFFDSRGIKLGSRSIAGSTVGQWIEYTAPTQGGAIARMDFLVYDYSFVDNFRMWHQVNR
jgi:hypothetical protein